MSAYSSGSGPVQPHVLALPRGIEAKSAKSHTNHFSTEGSRYVELLRPRVRWHVYKERDGAGMNAGIIGECT
jgi:hypothetical protein